jgi:hypothetical protein
VWKSRKSGRRKADARVKKSILYPTTQCLHLENLIRNLANVLKSVPGPHDATEETEHRMHAEYTDDSY